MGSFTIDRKSRQLLYEKFGFKEFYWFPLNGNTPKPDNTECFEDEVFFNKFGLQNLINTIKELGDNKINLISEVNEDEKINTEDLEPYTLTEIIYCNDTVDWAVYFSHENTVTISGARLIKAIQNKWEDFDALKATFV